MTQLTDDLPYDGAPAWSPDGQRIAFERMRGGNVDVRTLELQSGRLRNLTSDSAAHDGAPAWSPDGMQVAFTSWRNGDAELYVVELASGEARQLTSAPSEERLLGWQRDGQLLYSVVDGETQDIYARWTQDAPETPGARLTRWSVVGSGARSPEGSHLAYRPRYADGVRLLVQRVEGTFELPARLTEVLPLAGPLAWSALTVPWQPADHRPVYYTKK